MSFSDNSTVAVSHDIDGFFKPTDESRYAYDEISDDALHTSPYVASKIYSLDVGSPASRFLVHSEILEKSSIPPSTVTFSANISQPISLPELDAATAHTLVHYLYSSNYHVPNSSTVDSNAQYKRYKHATCVYCAAVRYSVPGLESIAKQVMIYKGFGLSIFEILTVARNHGFPLLPESDTQYLEYLEESITQAMNEDPEPFRKPDFITNFGGNSRLLQVIWKTVMSNYAVPPAPSDLNAVTDIGAKTPLAESLTVEDDTAAQDSSLYQLPSPTESVADSGRAVPPQREGLEVPDDLDLSAPTTQHAKSSIEASLDKPAQTVHTDVAMSDDFGLPAIEPTTELSEVSTPVTLPPTSMKKPGHVRADSVVEADLVPPKSTSHNETRITLAEFLRRGPDITGASSTSPDPVATAAVTSDNSVDNKGSITVGQLMQQLGGEHNDASKKNKKKSKKKHSSITF